MSIKVAKFRDVSAGTQPGQFAVGDRTTIDLARRSRPVVQAAAGRAGHRGARASSAGGGRANLTPMWFDYEGDNVLVNVRPRTARTGWIRENPRLTILLVNPDNPYHWVSIKLHASNARAVRGRPGRGRAGDRAARPDLDEVHAAAAAVRAARPVDRRAPRAVRVHVDQVATFGKP